MIDARTNGSSVARMSRSGIWAGLCTSTQSPFASCTR